MNINDLISEMPRKISKGSSTFLLAQAAIDAGLALSVVDGFIEGRVEDKAFIIKKGTLLVWNDEKGKFLKIDRRAVRKVSNKKLSKEILSAHGLSVAVGGCYTFDQKENAKNFAASLKSTVVKPSDGNKGRGVSVGVSLDSFDTAWNLAAAHASKEIVVEEEFKGGVEARYLVVDNHLLCVLKKTPPLVVGDGYSSIEELVKAKNVERKKNPHLKSRPIVLDEYRVSLLKDKGLTLANVPAVGEEVVLDAKSSFSTGGESWDITDKVHSSFRVIAEEAFKAIPDLRFAGIDIMAYDHSLPASDHNYIIVEINTTPALGGHHYPLHGKSRNPAKAMILSLMNDLK